MSMKSSKSLATSQPQNVSKKFLQLPSEMKFCVFSFLTIKEMFLSISYAKKEFGEICNTNAMFQELSTRVYNPKNNDLSLNELFKKHNDNWKQVFLSFFLKWSTKNKGKKIEVSEGEKKCTMKGDNTNQCIIMKNVFKKGIHRWKMKYEGKMGACVGICNPNTNLCDISGENYHQWIGDEKINGSYGIHLMYGYCYFDREVVKMLRRINSGSILEFTLDLEKGICSLKVGKMDHGVIFKDLTAPLSPATSFYYKNESLTIINEII